MKIKLWRENPGQGGVGSPGGEQSTVIEHGDKHPMPAGGEKVGDNSELHDWRDDKRKTKEEAK